MKKLLIELCHKFKIYDILKQLKINLVILFKKNTLNYIDLSNCTYQEAGRLLAQKYKKNLLENLPNDYDERVIEAYNLLTSIDPNLILELDSIADVLNIDKYLLLAKDLIFIPETCTSVAIKSNNHFFVGQNLDLGYDGKNLLVKKYKDYITVGLSNHPLWSTVGVNKYGITISGSSVNSISVGKGIIPSVINSKIILSKHQNIKDITDFFQCYKFFVNHDAVSYLITDKHHAYNLECDSNSFNISHSKDYAFTTNIFIIDQNKNLVIDELVYSDALKRENYFNITKFEGLNNGYAIINKYLSDHTSHVCAHSSTTIRYTTCSTIIDTEQKTFYFTSNLPCRAQKNDYIKISIDFNV